MNISKSLLLASVALVAVLPATALAQTADTPEATAAAPAAEDGEIVVTGLRRSLANSQELKRNASSVIEAISAEEIGKFTDVSLSEALNRIPGVQLQRNDNQESGDTISIRGLSGEYVRNQYNGREALSYGSGEGTGNLRTFNFDSLPTEIIGAVTIYKTSEASALEPGVAGAINVQSIRPLDFKSKIAPNSRFFGTAAVSGLYNDLAKVGTPRFSGLVGGKFFNNTLGVFVGGIWGKERTLIEQFRSNPVGNQTVRFDPTGARNPNVYQTLTNLALPDSEFAQLRGGNTRAALTAGAQWRPNDNLEVNIDFLYNKFDQTQNRGISGVSLAGSATDVYQPGGLTIDTLANGARVVTQLDTTQCVGAGVNGGCAANYGQASQRFDRRSDTIGGGLNIVWKNDDWKIRGDYSYNKLYFLSRIQFAGVGETPGSFSFSGYGGRNLPTYTQLSPTGNFSSLIDICCTFLSEGQTRADKHTFQLDVERRLTDELKLSIGGVHNRTTIDHRQASRFFFYNLAFGSTGANGQPGPFDRIFSEPERQNYLRTGFAAGGIQSLFPGTSLAYSYPFFDGIAACNAVGASYCADFTDVGTRSFNGPLPTTSQGLAALGDPLEVGGGTFLINERTFSGYAQLNYDGALGSLPVKANLGLRVLHEEVRANGLTGVRYQSSRFGFQTTLDNRSSFVNDGNSFTEFLPSLNSTFELANNINLRFAVSRTASLPSYEFLVPQGSATIYVDKSNPLYANIPDDATFGNTQLKPIKSWNFDLTFEYYTRNGGSFVLSGFDKTVSDFIFQTGQLSTVPALDAFPLAQGNVFNVVRPANINNGTVRGFELSANQPFTFLPGALDGFGFSGNFTFVDSKFDNPTNDPQLAYGFPGASKYNGSAILYYEKFGVAIRAAYVYRSKYLVGNGITPFAGNNVQVNRGYGTLDLTASYRILPQLEIFGAVTNVTRVRSINDYQPSSFFEGIRQRPRGYTLTLRGYF